MQAMIFAAGIGSRLRPFTDHHPKALAEVGGVPMLGRVILRLADAGVSRMVVNVHHFAGQIKDYLEANDNFGLDISVSDESDMLLDTGGGLLKAAALLENGSDEPIIVHNADILTDVPIGDMADMRRDTDAMATLLVARRDTARYFVFDGNMRLDGWTNISTGKTRPEGLDTNCPGTSLLAFGGVHVVSPAIFSALRRYATHRFNATSHDDIPPFSITDFYIDTCRDNLFNGYTAPPGMRWHDIGKPESLAAARASFGC